MISRCAAVESLDGTPQRVSTNASDCISCHPTAVLHFAARQRPLRHPVCEPDHARSLLLASVFSGVLHRRVVVSMPTAGSARTSPSPIVPRWISCSAGANGRSGSHGRKSMPARRWRPNRLERRKFTSAEVEDSPMFRESNVGNLPGPCQKCLLIRSVPRGSDCRCQTPRL